MGELAIPRRGLILGGVGLIVVSRGALAADTVPGRFVGNGKEARLSFASAWPRDPFSGKETIVIVLTEKDHSASKRPWFDAGFGKLGAALMFSLTKPDGRLIGTEADALPFACHVRAGRHTPRHREHHHGSRWCAARGRKASSCRSKNWAWPLRQAWKPAFSDARRGGNGACGRRVGSWLGERPGPTHG